MVYKKPLKRFDKFQLESKLIYWDDKWLYFKQTILKDDQLIANSLIKVIFRSKDGNVPATRILSSFGIEITSPKTTIIGFSENIDNILLETEEI
jgi:hypothetical protein